MHRLVLLLLLMVSGLCVHPAAAQGESGVRLVVLAGDDQPVMGLTLAVVDDANTGHALLTDANGTATAQGLPGTFFRITNAQQPDGTTVSIEATTLDKGLRLGLMPNQTRTVLLRLESNLLFVDPETIFSGTDAQHTIATAEALSMGDPTGMADTRNGGAERSIVVKGADEPHPSRWSFVVAVALSALLPLGLFALRALLQARRQKRRRI